MSASQGHHSSITWIDNGSKQSVSHVLLHGIGSNAQSWSEVLKLSPAQQRWLAWNAPGYDSSQALAMSKPKALDYAQALWSWLDYLKITVPIALAGHSLGALMAASAARLQPARVCRVVLLSPALGYGYLSLEAQAQRAEQRLKLLLEAGPKAMAKARASAMLSEHANEEQRQQVEDIMAQVDVHGYTQAVHMLMSGTLREDVLYLRRLRIPITIGCGRSDMITPFAQSRDLANESHSTLVDLGPVGHACAIEAPKQVLQCLLEDGVAT